MDPSERAPDGAGNDFFPQALRLCVKNLGEPREGILFPRRNFSIRIFVSISGALRRSLKKSILSCGAKHLLFILDGKNLDSSRSLP